MSPITIKGKSLGYYLGSPAAIIAYVLILLFLCVGLVLVPVAKNLAAPRPASAVVADSAPAEESVPATAPVAEEKGAAVAEPEVAPAAPVEPPAAPEVPAEPPAAAPVEPAAQPEAPAVPQEVKTVKDAKQVGGGDIWIQNWTDPEAGIQVIGQEENATIRTFMQAERVAEDSVKVVCVSSDPGALVLKDKEGKVQNGFSASKDSNGFVACIVVPDGWYIEIAGVGFNVKHYNTWAEVFVPPAGVSPDDLADYQIPIWQDTQAKSYAFTMKTGATEPEFLVQP